MRDVFGPLIAQMVVQAGKDPSEAQWRDYIPATLHWMAFLAYERRKRLEAQATQEQIAKIQKP